MVALNQKVFDRQSRQFPGSFSITSMTLGGIDITGMYAQLDIYESIFSPVMTAELTFFDTKNLPKNLPILGEEDFTCTVSDGVETSTYAFRTYKVRDRTSPKPSVLKYTVPMISVEGWRDSFFRISKFYGNTTHETAVADVLKQIQSSKQVIYGNTKGPRSWTFNYWSPLQCISWLASRSQSGESTYTGGTYLFYETVDGFKFVAVDNLLDTAANISYGKLIYDPIRQLVPNQAVAYNPDVARNVMRLEDYSVTRSSDVLENSRMGMYANQVRTIDLLVKAPIDTKFNYTDTFLAGEHLAPAPGFAVQPLSSYTLEALQHPEAMYRVALKCKGLFDDEPDGGSNIDQWLSPKLSQMQTLENFAVNFTLPGHIGMTAGMPVTFFLPDPTNVSISTENRTDSTYSGGYLITNLRRMFTRDKFWIVGTMVKDSRGNSSFGA